MLHVVDSMKPLEQLVADLEQAISVSFARECRIFEVCNPYQAKKVLEANLEISTALPCRISVYEGVGRPDSPRSSPPP